MVLNNSLQNSRLGSLAVMFVQWVLKDNEPMFMSTINVLRKSCVSLPHFFFWYFRAKRSACKGVLFDPCIAPRGLTSCWFAVGRAERRRHQICLHNALLKGICWVDYALGSQRHLWWPFENQIRRPWSFILRTSCTQSLWRLGVNCAWLRQYVVIVIKCAFTCSLKWKANFIFCFDSTNREVEKKQERNLNLGHPWDHMSGHCSQSSS